MEPNNPFALLELDFIKKKKTTPILFSIFKIISHQPHYSIHLQYKYKYTYPIEKVKDIIFKWLRESKGNFWQGVHRCLHTMGVGSGKEQWIEGQEGTLQSKWIWVIFFYYYYYHKPSQVSWLLLTNTLIYHSQPHSFSVFPSEKSG